MALRNVRFGNRRSARKRGGMAMVEMVIILPILLMLFFALVEFGVLFARWQTLSNAAREGARLAVVFRASCNAGQVQSDVEDRVEQYAATAGIQPADLGITVNGHCGGANTNSIVNVTFNHVFAVLPNFAPSVNPTIQLVGRSAMRNEG